MTSSYTRIATARLDLIDVVDPDLAGHRIDARRGVRGVDDTESRIENEDRNRVARARTASSCLREKGSRQEEKDDQEALHGDRF